METGEWLVGWREIGKYLRKSAKTAMRYAKKDGMPFYRDPAGRPIAKPSMIDEFIVDLNRDNYDDRKWKDKGINTALEYEDYKEKQREDFDQKYLEAQKPPRSRY
jgi:hypothetical protein